MDQFFDEVSSRYQTDFDEYTGYGDFFLYTLFLINQRTYKLTCPALAWVALDFFKYRALDGFHIWVGKHFLYRYLVCSEFFASIDKSNRFSISQKLSGCFKSGVTSTDTGNILIGEKGTVTGSAVGDALILELFSSWDAQFLPCATCGNKNCLRCIKIICCDYFKTTF